MSDYPKFGNVFVAVFNGTAYGKRLGRSAVVERFGRAGWKRVRERTMTGIMELFQHDPIPETKLYAEIVGQHAERHHAR